MYVTCDINSCSVKVTHLEDVAVGGEQSLRPGDHDPPLSDLVQSRWRSKGIVDVWIEAL